MRNAVSLLAAAGLVVAASSIADARGGPGKGASGASAFSPGQSFRMNGPVAGYHGASGYAPGQMKRTYGSVPGYPGASGYAPGRKFKPR